MNEVGIVFILVESKLKLKHKK